MEAKVEAVVEQIAFEIGFLLDTYGLCSTSEDHLLYVACVEEHFAYAVQMRHSYFFDFPMESFGRSSCLEILEMSYGRN